VLLAFGQDQSLFKLLLKKLERALLSDIARLTKTSKSLLARRVLLLGNNAALAGLHKIPLRQAAGRVLGRTVPNLGLCTNRNRAATHHVLASRVHPIFIAWKFWGPGLSEFLQ